MMLVPTYLALSKIPGAGTGCFSQDFIPRGTKIWEFNSLIDRIFSKEEVETFSPMEKEFVYKYSYMFAGKLFLCVDNARFFNHSKTPNTWESKDSQATYSLVDIYPGEEIVSDYFNFGVTEEDHAFNLNFLNTNTMIKKGDTVVVHYTGKFTNGEIFDTSEGREPLSFVTGESQVIKGFEEAIIGKSVGEKIYVTIPASDGYGELREDLIVDIPKANVPEGVEVGSILSSVTPDGQPFTVVVKEIKEETITVDMNHKMAGKDMIFEIEVVSIN